MSIANSWFIKFSLTAETLPITIFKINTVRLNDNDIHCLNSHIMLINSELEMLVCT